MKVDVIILSNGKTPELIAMCQKTIDTLHDSENKDEIEFFPRVYEGTNGVTYHNAVTINYDDEFHYNRLMNRGIDEAENRYILMANNDLIFHKHWARDCIDVMQKHGYLSVSPNHTRYEREDIREGYAISYYGEVKGWAILIDRQLMDKIGKIDESVNFWYSDNVYVDQLEVEGIKHALVRHAYVEHLESRTLMLEDELRRKELTDGQKKAYEEYRRRKGLDQKNPV
jgi:GT2 family glycosyltransferase